MTNFTDVKVFMETFGQMVRTKPQFPDDKTMKLRYDLIKEELNEMEYAMKTKMIGLAINKIARIVFLCIIVIQRLFNKYAILLG